MSLNNVFKVMPGEIFLNISLVEGFIKSV